MANTTPPPTVSAYPLQWPEGQPRTKPSARERAQFSRSVSVGDSRTGQSSYMRKEPLTLALGRKRLSDELERMRASYITLSTDVELRLDGQPYSNRREPDDPGAAIYFSRDGGQSHLCIACDRYDRVHDNVAALAKTIEALRGMERWGTRTIVDAAFSGFRRLPAKASGRAWWTVLGLADGHTATKQAVVDAYRAKARLLHPDNGGNPVEWIELQDANRQATDALAART